jgi:DNA-binding transcriptional LysR family regulator
VLTPTGALVLDHARRVLDHLERAEAEVDQFARGATGRLRIGTFQSVSTRLIPAILQRLQEVSPDVDVTVLEDDPEGDFRRAALQRGELDIGFVNGEPGDGFDGRFVVADPYVAIVPAGEPSGPIRLADLDGRAMVAMPVDDSCGRPIERAIEDLGVRPRYVFRTHDNGAVQAMVREGIGITIQPHLTVNDADPLIEVRPIEPVLPPRQIAVIWPTCRSLSPVARVAVDVAVEVGARIARTMRTVAPV